MRKWILRAVVVAAIVAAGYVASVTMFAPDPVPVRVIGVDRGRVESTVTNSKAGTVRARRRARLSPEIGGRVVGLPVTEGDRVDSGDVLLRLDTSALQAQLEKSQRDIVAARAEERRACLAAEQAQRESERYEALAGRRIVSENLLDQLRSQAATSAAACEAAGAAVASAEAAIGVLDAEVRKGVLRAPFAAVVAEVSVELGEWTTPSPTGMLIPPVVELIDTRSIYLSAPMDEVDSARIREGQRVRATVDPYPDRSFPGIVARVAPYVLDLEAQNRTVEIEVELDDAEFAATLLAGTSADVEVILEAKEGALRLPTSTLLEGNAVLVVREGVLVRHEVETGLRNWDFTEIVGGLREGDTVVTTLDRAEVREGAEVRVVDDPGEI